MRLIIDSFYSIEILNLFVDLIKIYINKQICMKSVLRIFLI